jgi:hypothetical protein
MSRALGSSTATGCPAPAPYTRWILEQSCATGAGFAHVSPESRAGLVQAADERVDVIRNEHQSVPSAGLRITASGASAARTRRAQVEREVIVLERREFAGIVLVKLELEHIPIKFDGAVDVVDYVSDGCHGFFPRRK